MTNPTTTERLPYTHTVVLMRGGRAIMACVAHVADEGRVLRSNAAQFTGREDTPAYHETFLEAAARAIPDHDDVVAIEGTGNYALMIGDPGQLAEIAKDKGERIAHGEGCDCDECAHRLVVGTFVNAAGDDEPRCPTCGAGMDSLELDEDDQRAFCNACATETPAETAIAEGLDPQRYMVCLDGGQDREGDDGLDRWAAMERARSLRVEHPDALVSIVLERTPAQEEFARNIAMPPVVVHERREPRQRHLAAWDPSEVGDVGDGEQFIRDAIGVLGKGFHPDTPFAEYIDDEGPMFDAVDATRLDATMERVFDVVDDPSEVALRIIAESD